MWCPDGYLTFDELIWAMDIDTYDVISGAHNRPPPDEPEYIPYGYDPNDWPDEHEVAAYHNWLVVALIDACRKDIRACLGSGNLIRLSNHSLAWSVSHKHGLKSAAALDAVFSRWRGGPFPDDYYLRLDLSGMAFKHLERVGFVVRVASDREGVAPIAGAPLCIKETALPVPPDRLRQWLVDNAWKDRPREAGDEAPSGAAIVEAFKAGRFKHKGEAHRMFGQDMKHIAWLAIWKEAVGIEPSLAKPGPRSG